MKSKGFALLPVLLVILGLVVVGGVVSAYLLNKNSQPQAPIYQPATTTPATQTASTTPVSVPGMRKYTDANFGFSFWYPDDLTFSDVTGSLFAEGFVFGRSDNQIVKQFQIDNVSVTEIHSPSTAIRLFADHGSPWNDAGVVTYYFDYSLHAWMAAWSGSGPDGTSNATTTADVSHNTMGGLHMLPLSSTFDDAVLVPLSAQNFLYISDQSGTVEASALANTVLALDPAVATPVTVARQQSLISAAAEVFAAADAPPPPVTLKSYSNAQWGFSLIHPSDFADVDALTLREKHRVVSYMGACPSNGYDPKGALALCYVGSNYPNGFAAASFIVSASTTISSSQCTGEVVTGTGTHAPTQKIVNGITYYESQTGDAGLGHYISYNVYSTYHNGACFRINEDMESYRTDSGASGDTTAIQNELDSILQSFTFTQ